MNRAALLPLAVLGAGCAMRPWTPAVSVAYRDEDVPGTVEVAVPEATTMLERWQLPQDCPWAPYEKLTLLTALDGAAVADLPDFDRLEVVRAAEIAGQRLGAAPLPSDTLYLVDLRGAASVAFGVALAKRASEPVALVPTFNNWPGENEMIPAEETLAAMLARTPPSLPRDETARPVFLLDAWRLAYRDDEPDEDVMDNRYFLGPHDLPSAETLRQRGITKVVYVVEDLDETDVEEDDIHESALAWQAAGVELYLVDLPWAAEHAGLPSYGETLPSQRLHVVARATLLADPAFFARARSGFGGIHGSPSPFAGTHAFSSSGHGGHVSFGHGGGG